MTHKRSYLGMIGHTDRNWTVKIDKEALMQF